MRDHAREEPPHSRDEPGGQTPTTPRGPAGGWPEEVWTEALTVVDEMADLPEMLTVAQVAKKFAVHDRTVRRWVKEGRIKAGHYGRAIRIPRSEVIRMSEMLSLRPKAAHAGGGE